MQCVRDVLATAAACTVRGGWSGVVVTAAVLYGAECSIELPSVDKIQLNDTERLQVLADINNYRSNVDPPASNMIGIVSLRIHGKNYVT